MTDNHSHQLPILACIEKNPKIPDWVREIEESLLQGIVRFLTSLHSQIRSKDIKFLCEPWVHFFSHSMLHRYEQIRKEKPIANQFHSTNSPPPGDTLSFIELSRTDDYRLMIDKSMMGETVSFKCRNSIESIFHKTASNRTRVTGYKTGLPRKYRYLLPWLSLNEINFVNTSKQQIECPHDMKIRAMLDAHLCQHISTHDRSLTTWLGSACAGLFPISILENLNNSLMEKKNLPKQTSLYSANAWDIIDEWKIYAISQKSLHKTKWIGSPHALNHGSLAIFWQREFELNYLDKYLTWGWIPKRTTHAKVIDFHPPHFPQKISPPPHQIDLKKGILISSAGRPCHLLEYPYYPEKFTNYIRTQLELAHQLQIHTQQKVVIRNRPKDLGWDLKKMVDDLKNPNISLEFQQGSFKKRLSNSALHVCDNLSTTIAESLMENHPTLVLITQDYFEIHPEAREAWHELARVGILHHSIEGLIGKIDQSGNDILAWWNNSDTQFAIKKFLFMQVREGANISMWKKVLLK